jgi:hypothetical protein
MKLKLGLLILVALMATQVGATSIKLSQLKYDSKNRLWPAACKFKISYFNGKNNNTSSCTVFGNDQKGGQMSCGISDFNNVNDKDSYLWISVIDGGEGKSIQDCYEAGGATLDTVSWSGSNESQLSQWTKGNSNTGKKCWNEFFTGRNKATSYTYKFWARLAGSGQTFDNGSEVMTGFKIKTGGGAGGTRIKSCTRTRINK